MPDQGTSAVPSTIPIDLLVDPVDGSALRFEAAAAADQGRLTSAGGRQYAVTNGIARFVETTDEGQSQTADAFGFKWGRTDTYQTASMRRSATAWLLKRYGFETGTAMREHLEAREPVLDLGCGSGYTASLWFDGWGQGEYVGVDISEAIDIAKTTLPAGPRTRFVQADALQLPFAPGSFGALVSEGVLHHTPSTRLAIEAAASVLRPGGEMLFYVYRKKSPIREWTDDYIRAQITPMSNADAWHAMESLTELGRALAGLRTEVDVPVDVPLLEIPAGRIDVQRLVYWHVAKLFWNDEYTFDENVHVNFDWYRPRYAHRQTEDEVRAWCADASLEIFHFDRDPAGFTVRAIRTGPQGRPPDG